jgi:hypothetical protein
MSPSNMCPEKSVLPTELVVEPGSLTSDLEHGSLDRTNSKRTIHGFKVEKEQAFLTRLLMLNLYSGSW